MFRHSGRATKGGDRESEVPSVPPRRSCPCALTVGTALALPSVLSPHRGDPQPPATAGAKGAVGNRTAPVTAIAYRAAPGQDNRVTVTESSAPSGQITYVIDDVVPISPMPGCEYISGTDRTKVSCVAEIEEMATDPYRTLFVELGDGDDTIRGRKADGPGRTYSMGYTEFSLGPGEDNWEGTSSEVRVVYGGRATAPSRCSAAHRSSATMATTRSTLAPTSGSRADTGTTCSRGRGHPDHPRRAGRRLDPRRTGRRPAVRQRRQRRPVRRRRRRRHPAWLG